MVAGAPRFRSFCGIMLGSSRWSYSIWDSKPRGVLGEFSADSGREGPAQEEQLSPRCALEEDRQTLSDSTE